MTVVSLTFCVLLGQVPAVDPFELIPQLGSTRYAERQAASSMLERLGRRALPALRAAREQKDEEIRVRAANLQNRIEGALLTQPSQVRLDYEDVSLGEIIRSFSEQSGIKLSLIPDNSHLKDKRMTIHESSPLPFWKALDRLCEVAQLQYNHGNHPAYPGRDPTFPLFAGSVRSSAPTYDTGPFRVSVIRLHYQDDLSFAPVPNFGPLPRRPAPVNPPAAIHSEQYTVQFQVAAEPRLSLSQGGMVRINEAVDDKGNQLAIPATSGPDLRRSGYFGFATGSVVQLQTPLIRPRQPGAMIKRLKGVVPVIVSTRKPDPLVVPLAGAAGRTFKNDDVALTVHDLRNKPNDRPPSIEVSIQPGALNTSASAGGLPMNEMFVGRPDFQQQHIEVTDAQGHLIPWYQSSYDAESGRLTVSLTSPEQATLATELHYFSLVRASTEVPFEFSDVPMR